MQLILTFARGKARVLAQIDNVHNVDLPTADLASQRPVIRGAHRLDQKEVAYLGQLHSVAKISSRVTRVDVCYVIEQNAMCCHDTSSFPRMRDALVFQTFHSDMIPAEPAGKPSPNW